jgi:hypothetical protein
MITLVHLEDSQELVLVVEVDSPVSKVLLWLAVAGPLE